MKKNITVNIQGCLYSIDEDAYELLKQYENSLHDYFSREDGGAEIVDDIESRIVELFNELVASGKAAIDIDDVQRIIKQIGNPQQMDDGNDSVHSNNNEEATIHSQDEGKNNVWQKIERLFIRKDRRFFRDPSDKKIFGVISGMAHYYGGDATIWRIIIVIVTTLIMLLPWHLSEMAFYLVVVYCFLGLIIPPANTPEDRLRMKGKTVTPQNLAEEVTEEGEQQHASQRSSDMSQSRGCLSSLGNVFIFLLKIVMFFFIGGTFLVVLSLFIALLTLLFFPSLSVFADNGIMFSWNDHPWVGTVGLVCLALLITLAILGIGQALASRRHPLSITTRVLLMVILLASLSGTVICGTVIISNLKEQTRLFDNIYQKQWEKSHMHNGVFIDDEDWTYLQSGSWKLLSHENCNNHYTGVGEYYTGNMDRRYLESQNDEGMQLYRVERTDSMLQPGTYSLTATVRSDGTGAYIYAIADGKIYKAEIPAEGKTGGSIWQKAHLEYTTFSNDSVLVGRRSLVKDMANANDGSGFGWSTVTINGIVTKGGCIKYGLTTVPSITKDQFIGTWFSADDFRLKQETAQGEK